MILNRTGAEFAYEGVTYTIGGAIVGTAESEYAGLYGRINAIHDGEDKETENETPDIYCEFDPPVMPHEVKALEDTFSDLYHQPKTIADIVLDMVIMAPEMIRPLDDLRSMRKRVNVFLVMEDWAVDGEHGNDCEAFSDYDDAKRIMTNRIREELEDGSVPSWRECRLAEANAADLIEVIVTVDTVLTGIMDLVLDHLPDQPEVLLHFSLLGLCKRHDASPPLHGRNPAGCCFLRRSRSFLLSAMTSLQ